MSLPSRERGLKSLDCDFFSDRKIVAPLAGAWIEIQEMVHLTIQLRSLPSRERGLKFMKQELKHHL